MPKIRRVAVAIRAYKLAASRKSAMKKNKRRTENHPETVGTGKEKSYDPATGTNWCHLPMELRTMCIEKMNFKTRACLRGTSNVEKALVESKKYNVLRIDIRPWCFLMESRRFGEEQLTEAKVEELNLATREEARKQSILLKLVFKLSKIDMLLVNSGNIFHPEDFSKHMPIHCDELVFDAIDASTMVFIARNCRRKMDHIDFYPTDHFPLSPLATLPPVYTALSISFKKLACACFVPHIVNKWIDEDAEIGTRLTFEVKLGETYQQFSAFFRERIIEDDEDSLLLDMDGPNHIQISIDSIWSEDGFEMAHCEVIH